MDIELNKSIAIVLRTIIYYDIFRYPLTESDLLNSCNLSKTSTSPCINAINYLVDKKIVYKIDDYYSLTNNSDGVKRRIKGNEDAKKWMKKAYLFSKIISWFPFVRGISLSGSLSKGFVDSDPDIDYFIITKPNRLWITRSFLTAFKVIFLLNSYKYFCLNYFVASNKMEIEEKNLFTATEIITMIPVFGDSAKRDFFESNRWIKEFYPSFEAEKAQKNIVQKSISLKRFFEFILEGKLGDKLDDWFMKINIKFRRAKFGKQYSEEEFLLSFKSEKNISKHHPENFQKKVMDKFQSKLKEIEKEFEIELDAILIDLN